MNIRSEDFDLVPANQDLYCADEVGNRILKLPSSALSNFVGDVLVTQASDHYPKPASLIFLHWESSITNFVLHEISVPVSAAIDFEHVTFAPISIPSHSP